MAKIPTILEAGRADGKLIKTNSVYDYDQEKFLSDKIKEIDNSHNELNDIVNSLTNTVNNNKLDIENKLEKEQNRATTAENNLRETINNITNINEHAATAELITVNTLPNSTISNVQQALDDLYKNIIYDVSALNNGAAFKSLSSLLSSSDLSTLIPTSVRHEGMTIRFIQGSEQSSDNKYVQYIYNSTNTAVADFTNTSNWKKIVIEEEITQLDNDKVGREYVKNLFDKDNPENGTVSFFSRPLSHKIYVSTKKIYLKKINSCIVIYDENNSRLGYSLGAEDYTQGSGYTLYEINNSWNASYIRVGYTNGGDDCVVFEGENNLLVAYNESPSTYVLPSPYKFDWINRDSPYFGVDTTSNYRLTDIMYIPANTTSIVVKDVEYYIFLSDAYGDLGHGVLTSNTQTLAVPSGATYLRVGCQSVEKLTNAMVTNYSVFETEVPSRNSFIEFVIRKLNTKSIFAQKNIVVTGDSIALGYNDKEGRHGWSGRVCDTLGAVMIDYTKSGASAAKRQNDSKGINSFSFVETSKIIAQLSSDIDVVFIAFGTNDQGNLLPKSPLIDVIDKPEDEYNFTSAYYYSLKRIIESKPNASIFLLNYFANNTDADSYYGLIKTIGEYLAIPVIDVLHESGITPMVAFSSTLYFSDGLHPNAAGYAKMAECILGKIKNWALIS